MSTPGGLPPSNCTVQVLLVDQGHPKHSRHMTTEAVHMILLQEAYLFQAFDIPGRAYVTDSLAFENHRGSVEDMIPIISAQTRHLSTLSDPPIIWYIAPVTGAPEAADVAAELRSDRAAITGGSHSTKGSSKPGGLAAGGGTGSGEEPSVKMKTGKAKKLSRHEIFENVKAMMQNLTETSEESGGDEGPMVELTSNFVPKKTNKTATLPSYGPGLAPAEGIRGAGSNVKGGKKRVAFEAESDEVDNWHLAPKHHKKADEPERAGKERRLVFGQRDRNGDKMQNERGKPLEILMRTPTTVGAVKAALHDIVKMLFNLKRPFHLVLTTTRGALLGNGMDEFVLDGQTGNTRWWYQIVMGHPATVLVESCSESEAVERPPPLPSDSSDSDGPPPFVSPGGTLSQSPKADAAELKSDIICLICGISHHSAQLMIAMHCGCIAICMRCLSARKVAERHPTCVRCQRRVKFYLPAGMSQRDGTMFDVDLTSDTPVLPAPATPQPPSVGLSDGSIQDSGSTLLPIQEDATLSQTDEQKEPVGHDEQAPAAEEEAPCAGEEPPAPTAELTSPPASTAKKRAAKNKKRTEGK